MLRHKLPQKQKQNKKKEKKLAEKKEYATRNVIYFLTPGLLMHNNKELHLTKTV